MQLGNLEKTTTVSRHAMSHGSQTVLPAFSIEERSASCAANQRRFKIEGVEAIVRSLKYCGLYSQGS